MEQRFADKRRGQQEERRRRDSSTGRQLGCFVHATHEEKGILTLEMKGGAKKKKGIAVTVACLNSHGTRKQSVGRDLLFLPHLFLPH